MRAVPIALLILTCALCACGKYGAPVRPGAEEGVTVSGAEAAQDDAGAPVPEAWEAPEEKIP
jgi:hypothetical protein